MSIGEPGIRGSAEVADRAWGFVLAVFVVSRLFYLISGTLLVKVVPIDLFQRDSSTDIPFGTLNIWTRMDGDHFLNIAESGYENEKPAHFPLYPLLVRFSAELLGGPISRGSLSTYGVIVSLVAFFFALYFVYRVAEQNWGVRVAEGTTLTLAFFPTAFFFNAFFSESLFLMLSAGAIWAARVRKDLPLACLFAMLATPTRIVGVLLLIPLAYEWWRNRHEYGSRAVSYLAFVPVGLATYATYLWWRFGNPLLFYSGQADWGRAPIWATNAATEVFRLAYENARALFDPANYEPFGFDRLVIALSGQNYLYNLVFFLFALTVLAVGWRLLPAGLGVYGIALIVVSVLSPPLDNPLMSMPRYVLVAFPLFIVLGALLKDRRLLAGWLLASAAISLVFTALFVGWYFVA